MYAHAVFTYFNLSNALLFPFLSTGVFQLFPKTRSLPNNNCFILFLYFFFKGFFAVLGLMHYNTQEQNIKKGNTASNIDIVN